MKTILCLLLATVFLGACSSNDKDLYIGQNAHYIYAKGQYYLKEGDYSDAITAYQSLNAQYPFGVYSKKGDLSLVYAYYKHADPALALAACVRYIRLYPRDKHLDYIYYMSGIINFNNGRGFLQRHFPYHMADHNPSNYTLAFNDFKTVVTNYPESKYALDARRRMIFLKNTMAQFDLNVAEYYYHFDAYVAAIHRAKLVLLHYPRTPQVKGALKIMKDSYGKLGLSKLEQSSAKMISYNFPTKHV